jgi:hypothetical protein
LLLVGDLRGECVPLGASLNGSLDETFRVLASLIESQRHGVDIDGWFYRCGMDIRQFRRASSQGAQVTDRADVRSTSVVRR